MTILVAPPTPHGPAPAPRRGDTGTMAGLIQPLTHAVARRRASAAPAWQDRKCLNRCQISDNKHCFILHSDQHILKKPTDP